VAQAASGKEFVWQYGGHTIGRRLTVPTGFAIQTYDYREGIVTTLRYADEASIVLQSGGMYPVPMLQNSDHKLTSSTELAVKTIRVGQIAGSTLYWREDNFKPSKVTGKDLSIRGLFPPNIAYTRVPQSRRADFDHALNSFVQVIENTPGQDPQRIRFAALVSKVEPAYPVVAQKNGIQGAVWLDVAIGKDGHVASVQSISGNSALVGAAEDAVLQWVYRPTLLNGEPLEVIMKVCVPFVPRQSKQTPSPCAPPTNIF
jgi:hypothetical protein